MDAELEDGHCLFSSCCIAYISPSLIAVAMTISAPDPPVDLVLNADAMENLFAELLLAQSFS